MYPIPEKYSKKKSDGDDLDVDVLRKTSLSSDLSKDSYKEHFHNLLWLEEVQAKRDLQKSNLYDVRLLKLENKKGAARYLLRNKDKSNSIQIGARILLKARDLGNKCFVAIVKDIDNTYITLKVLRLRGLQYDLCDTRFDVVFLLSRLTFVNMHAAVEQFTISKIFPQESNDDTICSRIDRFFNQGVKMNMGQRTAVECIVAGTSGAAPFLLHGPPGTGKTVTIVEAILQLVIKNGSNRILVCAHSNTAVDNVACLLLKYTKIISQDPKKAFLRINSACRTSPPECLKDVSSSGKVAKMGRYRILLCTLNLASNFDLKFITHTIIDEAAQATEPSCLIPKSEKLILSGDFKQLGPVVVSDAAKKFGLGISLMERLKKTCPLYAENNNKYIVMLKNNYRSDADIIKLPNLLFYDGQLKAMAETDLISRTNILYEDEPCRAIVFHGVLSTEKKVGDPPRKRSPNWQMSEKMLLVDLVAEHFSVVENKRTDAVTMKQKNAEWVKISEEFNSQTTFGYRTAENVKAQWESLKKSTKKESSAERQSLFQTGGGPSKPKLEDNPLYRKIFALISTTVVGLVNEYDSDNMSNNHFINEEIPSNTLASTKVPDVTDIFVAAPIYSMSMPLSMDIDTSGQNDDKPQGETADWGDYTPKLLQTPKSASTGSDYSNIDELMYIKKYVKKLIITHGVEEEDIGIIATYSSQVALIKEWVQKNHLKIDVETVDAFQGQEKRVILISTVRGKGKQTTNVKLGFITDAKALQIRCKQNHLRDQLSWRHGNRTQSGDGVRES
ncbi:unnamed protein product [Parnassius apollo]|uniref:Regulatory protein zeste n=1 Tax=Parnassius apollo TaxID=110799 RepID=A0A8S3VZH4_PARAO|nr:unnamed protein product [Parnassius apollo]